MGFGNLNNEQGVKALDDFLAERSYIEGYVPSQADVAVFQAMSNQPAAKYCHVLRWYNHMKSYKSQFTSFPGIKKNISEYGPSSTPAANGAAVVDDEEDDDDDIDLFGSGDEDEAAEAEKIKEERIKAYADKKAKKPGPIAKSSIILEVKPWDDETDIGEMEKCVRSIVIDGLLWGAAKKVPVGYGIMKLQIGCVVEDDKVGTDILEESITAFEDLVQSVDIAAFNKI